MDFSIFIDLTYNIISLKNTKKHCMPVTVLVHAHAHVRVTLYMQRILIIQI